jgi:CubicO group peptidase (beta-lactamase class C family)
MTIAWASRVLLAACLSLAGAASAEAGDGAGPWPTREWRVSTPEEQGMDSAALARLVDYGAAHHLESLLVVRHGVIVAEAYYAPFRAGLKHRVNSVTKSVIGSLVAIALKSGLIDGPDHKVVDYFPERTIANLDDRKKAITIGNLLNMTSGLAWDEPLNDDPPASMLAMERGADWVQYVLDRPMATAPGAAFNYDSGSTHLLSAILGKAAHESVLDFARERLFGPLGISDVFWRLDPQGIPNGGYGLFLLPRDMAKLGYLYLRNGAWDGEEIVPREWIDAIRHATTPMGIANLRYANLFWVNPDANVYFASGFRGQRILIMPALDIVAVTTAAGGSSEAEQIAMIAAAVKSDAPLPPDAAAQALLASRTREVAIEKPTLVREAPEIAKAVSGKLYRFADNPVGVETVTLTLDGPDPSYAYTIRPRQPDEQPLRFEGPMGLDGRYRTGPPKPDGTIPAAMGAWSYDGTFFVQLEDIGGDDLRKLIFSFKDKSVDVTIIPKLGPSVELHGQTAE